MTWLDHVAERAIGQGRNKIRLDAVTENKTLCDFYIRRGFMRIDEIMLPHWRRSSTRFEKPLN